MKKRGKSLVAGWASVVGLAMMIAMTDGLLPSTPAEAGHRRGRGSIRQADRYESRRIEIEIEYDDRGAIELQRESIAAREEALREQGRRQRRDEIEKTLDKEVKEYLEFQESLRSSNQAARRSPRGFFYRRPGSVSSSLPKPHEVLEANGVRYYYHQGIFYRESPSGYDVVHPPVGIVVGNLPLGCVAVSTEDQTLYYYFGTYFEKAAGKFRVISPPPGAIVPYLPDGYRTEHAEGKLHYVFGDVRYRPYYREGVLVYAVVGI